MMKATTHSLTLCPSAGSALQMIDCRDHNSLGQCKLSYRGANSILGVDVAATVALCYTFSNYNTCMGPITIRQLAIGRIIVIYGQSRDFKILRGSEVEPSSYSPFWGLAQLFRWLQR